MGFGGGWHRAGHRGNLGEFFQELEGRPTKAQTNDALSIDDLLAVGGGMQGLKDVLSAVVKVTLQELIEAEVTAGLGAGRCERSEGRSGTRNSSRPRTVSTPAGDVEVKIPKLRKGSFFQSCSSRAPGRPSPLGIDHDCLRHGHVHQEGR